MRRLILMRHAKSAWSEPVLADFDRPLSRRGKRIAPMMGAYIDRERLLADYTLISPARRTRDTWQLLGQAAQNAAHGFDERIYEASDSTLLGLVRAMPGKIASLMIIGHNPGLQELACALARRDRSKARRAMEEKFSTAALCVLDFAVDDWADIMPDTGLLERFVTPHRLGFTLEEV